MDNQVQPDPEPRNDPQQSLYSESNTSIIKKVGTIVNRKRSITQADHHPKTEDQLPQLSQASYRIKNRRFLFGRGQDQGSQRSRVKGLGETGVGIKGKVHVRSRSYQEQRRDLERELLDLTQRQYKLEELRDNKKKLKAKLNQLQFQLKEIKNSEIKNKLTELQNKTSKLSKIKSLKKPKLKPITIRENTEPSELKVLKTYQKQRKQRDHQNDHGGERRGEDSDEEEVVNYFYEAELHHKCLNCQHFNIKIEDVRIPTQIRNDFNL